LQFRNKLREMLTIEEPPHRIAAAFAVGVFIGMSPFLGIHTLLGLVIAWQFKLNKLVTVMGVFVTNPWTIVPIYTFGTWVGTRIIGVESIIPVIDWSHITFFGFLGKFRHLVLPFIVGNIVTGLISAVVSYFLIYRAVKISRG
jgi:uncharacterized protein (DUF2062 family)